MSQFLELLWRSFAIALGIALALVIGFILLSLASQAMTAYTQHRTQRPTGNGRIALLNEGFNIGLSLMGTDDPKQLKSDGYPEMQRAMQAFFDSKRIRDKVTMADVSVIHGQSIMPSPGLVEGFRQALEGKQ